MMVGTMADLMAASTDLSTVVMMVGLMDYSQVDSMADPRDNSQAAKMVASTAAEMANRMVESMDISSVALTAVLTAR